MPLTDFQRQVLAILAASRTGERYLAGGAALHFAPNSLRYSQDLDFFHDSAERVAETFAADQDLLLAAGYAVDLLLSQAGFIRVVVQKDGQSTRIDWAHDSAWRFMPLLQDDLGGFLLHPVDLAVNKVLTLAGRDEVRDFVDVMYVHESVLSLGALIWGASGKDPGFTPLSLLEQLKRRGRPRPEDLARLDLAEPFDLVAGKQRWIEALAEAETFVSWRPPEEIGCLYYAPSRERFETPSSASDLPSQGLVPHFGRPGGVLPRPADLTLRDR